MTITELVALIAKESGIPEKRVSLYARRLKEKKFIPQSKGRFYPGVSFYEAASLIVALVAAENPQHAASTAHDYSALAEKVGDYLMRDDKGRLRRIGVDRQSGVAFVQERGPDDVADTESVIYPRSVEQSARKAPTEKNNRIRSEAMQNLGQGRFRLMAEFDELFLGSIWSAFENERNEMIDPESYFQA